MIDSRTVKLSTLYKVPNRNGVYVTKENHGFGISIINMGELFGNNFIRKGEGERVNLNKSEKEISSLIDGDLLFARRSLVESGAGKCAIVLNPEEEMTFESSVIRIRLDKMLCNPLFYYYWFMSGTGKNAMRTLVTGSNVKGIKGSELGTLDVPYIPLDQQNAIADLLYTFDNKIENNNAICADLEAMAKLLYDYWFVQFDFPDENGKPYKSSGGKMIWNDDLKRDIPEGWEVKQISDITKRVKVGFVGTVDKYYCSNEEGFPIVRPAEMSTNGIDYGSLRHITVDFYNKNKKSQVHKNDILISRCGKDGIPNIYDSDEPGQVLNAVIIEPDNDMASSNFIQEMLKSDYSQVQISHRTSGSVQGVINTEMIAKILLSYNQSTVKAFSKTIKYYYALMSNAKKENDLLASFRDFLLPMLMNGQVKVGGTDDQPSVPYPTDEAGGRTVSSGI